MPKNNIYEAGNPTDAAIDHGRGNLLASSTNETFMPEKDTRTDFINIAKWKRGIFSNAEIGSFAKKIQSFLDKPEEGSGNFFTLEEIPHKDLMVKQKIAEALVNAGLANDLGEKSGIRFFSLNRKEINDFDESAF